MLCERLARLEDELTFIRLRYGREASQESSAAARFPLGASRVDISFEGVEFFGFFSGGGAVFSCALCDYFAEFSVLRENDFVGIWFQMLLAHLPVR